MRFNGPYRQSLLKAYSECPRKFRLLNIDGVYVPERPSAKRDLGTDVHKHCHLYHQGEDINAGSMDPDAYELVAAYIKNNHSLDVIASEQPFEFKMGGHVITGTIDLIYRDAAGRVIIRDIKTDSSEPSPEFLARDIQFSTYYLGAVLGLGITPDIMEWYHIRNLIPYKRRSTRGGVQFEAGESRGPASFWVSRQVGDMVGIIREIGYIIQGIRFNIFPMRPLKIGNITTCNLCNVQSHCIPHGQVVEPSTDGLLGLEEY